MAEQKNALTSWVLLFLPPLILWILSTIIEPLDLLFSEFSWSIYVAYSAAFGIGGLLYYNSRMVRDFEWQRSKAVKKLGKHYSKEDKGLWAKGANLSGELGSEVSTRMDGKIGDLNREIQTPELALDKKIEVNLLSEAEHVVKSTRRLSGNTSSEDDTSSSTIGAIRKASPMDRFLDWLSVKMGRQNPVSDQEKHHQFPIDSSKTLTPDKVEPESDVVLEPIKKQIIESPTKLTSSDNQATPVSSTMTLEEMASLNPPKQNSSSPSISGQICRGCRFTNPNQNRFCDNCGNNL